jgi:hypothetical protein
VATLANLTKIKNMYWQEDNVTNRKIPYRQTLHMVERMLI